MKMHFTFFEDCGSYENPASFAEKTICGYGVGDSLEKFVTDIWEDISCKKCLALKSRVLKAEKEDEKHIINQMAEMAEFMEELNE